MRMAGYEPRVKQLGPGRFEVGYYDEAERTYCYTVFKNMEEAQKFIEWLDEPERFDLPY